MLPNESLLQVLQFADYRTLVLTELAGAHFRRLIVKFSEELARRRRYLVYFYTTCIEYNDMTIGEGGRIEHELRNHSSLAAACRELHELIGTGAVAVLTFYGNTWNVPGVDVVFEAAPALKYAEDVALHSPRVSSTGGESSVFMSNFAVMKSLGLWFDYDTFRQFSWVFLRQESSRRLQRISVYVAASAWTENDLNRAVEELVRDCATLPRPLRGQPLKLDFSANKISRVLVLRILELLKDSTLELTFRTILVDGGEFILDKSEFTIDVDGSTTRYASQKSGIVVGVKGHAITIQSTAQVPCKKLRTSEEHS